MFKMTRNEAARLADEATDTMTAAQFVAFWLHFDDNGGNNLSYAAESIAEWKSEHASECGMFGDSGPGVASWLAEANRKHAAVVARLWALGALDNTHPSVED